MRVRETCGWRLRLFSSLASVTLVKMLFAFYRDPEERIPVLFLEFITGKTSFLNFKRNLQLRP
jgi:hypothetical protein